MNHLVSIIMPTFNSETVIIKAIDSVISQSYSNWELIIIDNESIDKTLDSVRNYGEKRIKILKIKNNGIIAKSRNLGIRASKGGLIAFLDSDDWWTENKLSESILQIERGYDFVFHKLKIVNKSKKLLLTTPYHTRKIENSVFEDLLKYGNFIQNSSVVVKKYLLECVNFLSEDSELIAAEDYDCWLKISKITNKYYCINTVLGYYFYDGNGANNLKNKEVYVEFLKNKYLKNPNIVYEGELPIWVLYYDLRRNFLKKNYCGLEKAITDLSRRDIEFTMRVKISYMSIIIFFKKIWKNY